MAADQHGLMAELGHRRYAVAGHDRGARVAHRLCLDPAGRRHPRGAARHPPDGARLRLGRQAAGHRYYHWFFYLSRTRCPSGSSPATRRAICTACSAGGAALDVYDPGALAEYERCFADADARHAMLEDYRAGATVDYDLDTADLAGGRVVVAPLLVLWGARGAVGRGPDDPLAVWRTRAREGLPAPRVARRRVADQAAAVRRHSRETFDAVLDLPSRSPPSTSRRTTGRPTRTSPGWSTARSR